MASVLPSGHLVERASVSSVSSGKHAAFVALPIAHVDALVAGMPAWNGKRGMNPVRSCAITITVH